MSLNIISQNLNIVLSKFQNFMIFVVVKHIDFETLQELVERKREKNKMQKQKHYISKFDQIFDLKRSNKLKIREFLNVFEILQIFENFTQNQIIQYFFNKIEFINQFDNQIVIAQNQIVVAQNEQNKKFETRFDEIQKQLKRFIDMQNNDREKRAREKLFAKYTQFNSFSLISNLVNIVANDILFKKKREKKQFDSNDKKKRFCKFDIKYFDSHYFEVFDKNDLIVIDDKTYYRNV